MPILRWILLSLAGVLTAHAATTPRLLMEMDDAELLRQAPELIGLRVDHDEALTAKVLRPALAALQTTFHATGGWSAAEHISELRLDEAGVAPRARSEQFRYVAQWGAGSADVHEQRLNAADQTAAVAGEGGFFVSGQFLALVEIMLPEHSSRLRFRPVGRLGDLVVFAFAGTPDAGVAAGTGMQGLVWVDGKRARPARLRCQMVAGTQGQELDELRVDMSLAEVRFAALESALLLPVHAVVDAAQGSTRMHTVHRFSDFRLAPDFATAGSFTAEAPVPDAVELLAEGAAAVNANNATAALEPLRQALRMDATLAAAHFHLARALRATGDGAGAESEARAALKAMPDIAPMHNLVGLLLMERGDAAGAATAFRETLQLAPQDAPAHANLAKALESTGDRDGAVAELRRALELAPANEALRQRLARLSGGAPLADSAHGMATIRVDVRQVLVPVVVHDKAGHAVGDLKQTDFRVLEDGVEQTIASFRVETTAPSAPQAEAPAPTAATTVPSAKPRVARAAPAGPLRHTYLIVIDSLHAGFGNLHGVHESLKKFFAGETAGDSQYAVIVLGQSTTILQNMTRDPAVAMAAMDNKAFYKMFGSSQMSAAAAETAQYLRHLDDVRAKVDSLDRRVRESGLDEMKQLPQEASQLAAMDRGRVQTLLGGLRELVRQLSAGSDQRTLLLMSDGFHLSPGRDAWEMLIAYFPELTGISQRVQDRMQMEFESIVRLAAKANVVINTIDSRGLYTNSFLDASTQGPGGHAPKNIISVMNSLQSDAASPLVEFAVATGGTAFQNSNDILGGVRKAVAEGRNYYTLGYVPAVSAMDGKFRNISVEIKGRKLSVRAKRGYWATAD